MGHATRAEPPAEEAVGMVTLPADHAEQTVADAAVRTADAEMCATPVPLAIPTAT